MKRGVTAPWFLGAALAAVALFSSFSAAATLPVHKTAAVPVFHPAFHRVTTPAAARDLRPHGSGPGIVGGKPASAGISGSGFKKYGAGR